jgi:hypothetical protein
VRPVRRYQFVFRHTPTGQSVVLLALGNTPCAARNQAFDYLEKLKKADALPPDDWRMERQEDRGLAG